MSKERELLGAIILKIAGLEGMGLSTLIKESKELLAQPEQIEQEPVALHYVYDDGERPPNTNITQSMPLGKNYTVTPLYAFPPKLTPRQGLAEYIKGYAKAEDDLKRMPLSDKEIGQAFLQIDAWHRYECFIAGVRAVEKAHGIGE